MPAVVRSISAVLTRRSKRADAAHASFSPAVCAWRGFPVSGVPIVPIVPKGFRQAIVARPNGGQEDFGRTKPMGESSMMARTTAPAPRFKSNSSPAIDQIHDSLPTQIAICGFHIDRQPVSITWDIGVLRQADLANGRFLGQSGLDGAIDRAAQRHEHLAKAGGLLEVRRHTVTGYHDGDVEFENASERVDPAVE